MPKSLFAHARDLIGGRRGLLAAGILARADAARDAGRALAAAHLYEEAGTLRPGRPAIHIQCGHMFKEAGLLERAGHHYLTARALAPEDADLWLQLGHFHKVAGQLEEAEAAYRRALALDPTCRTAADEAARLEATSAVDADAPVGADRIDPEHRAALLAMDRELAVAGAIGGGRLVPALAPRAGGAPAQREAERIEVRRLGQREPSHWGNRPTLRGVAAIRGFCISAAPVTELEILLNDALLHRGPLGAADVAPGPERTRKFVFNVWADVSGFEPGLYRVRLRVADADGGIRSWRENVVVAAPLPESASPGSDALVAIDPADPRPLEEQVRTRPSMVRAARRDLFPDGVRAVLVMRTDQLGDLVASIPALRRLRALVPGARIVGLLTTANAALAETLALFDEIIVVDFPDDPVEQRRTMPLAEQAVLLRRLRPYAFDIALDLALSEVSRDLLQLAGARFVYGVGSGDFPFVTGEFAFNTRDRWTRMDVVPHSAKVLAMVEALGAVLATNAPIIRRADLSHAVLARYGIGTDDRYVLLHAGARVIFGRWPHYAELASLILERTALKVVLMPGEAGLRATIPAALLASERFQLLEGQLPFDDFDALISFAQAIVGNDSGPKHLAALRGTNVVTLFTARINWNEWGQENVGKIMSRRVPCAGCAIFHHLEECGKGFACIVDIAPDEVFDALAEYL